MKYVKLTVTCQDEEGRLFERTLNNKEAERWQEYMIKVCQFASEHHVNPKWEKLNWLVKELKLNSK